MGVRVDVEKGDAFQVERTHDLSFTAYLGGAEVCFEAEADAVRFARRILERVGELPPPPDFAAVARQSRQRCAEIARTQAEQSKRHAELGYPDEAHLAAEMIAEAILEDARP